MIKGNQSKPIFVILGTVVILVGIWITWKSATPGSQHQLETRSKNIRWWYPLPPFVEPTPFVIPVRPTASTTAETNVLAERSDEPETVSPIAQSKGEDFNLLSIKTFSPAPISFQTIAVVDVDRLLLAYPLSSDSKEARVRLLADIQHAIAVCASAHNFTLVLDRGGQSLTQLPVVLSAADPFDVTDEVAQQLAYVRPADPSR